jgi:hypothetical protein
MRSGVLDSLGRLEEAALDEVGSWGVLDRAGKTVEWAGCVVEVEHVKPEKKTIRQLIAAWRRSSMCGEEEVGGPHSVAL